MGTFGNESSMEGDVYVQRLATYIRRNEEGLANGLLCFSKARQVTKIKPLRPSFTIHHLYYITERIEASSLGVDVGPLNIKLDTPNHEPTFISFMANNAKTLRQFESDARSITSINSVKLIVSSASVYWRSFAFSKDPKVIQKDVKYLYLSFTKIPCLILNPKTKINTIAGYEEYPCDTSVPLRMFKNLQVLELVEYEPNEVFGWHVLSEQLRILIIRNSKVSDLAEVLLTLVVDDETGRSSFSNPRRRHDDDSMFRYRQRAMTNGTRERDDRWQDTWNIREDKWKESDRGHEKSGERPSKEGGKHKEKKIDRETTKSKEKDKIKDTAKAKETEKWQDNTTTLQDNKWFHLKQLTVCEGSITQIPAFVFRPLTNLVKLNLSNNLLEELPDGLHHLVNIKYMNFADNFITSLDKLPAGLAHLTTLNFNNNRLASIAGIENLAAIEKIDLRRNKLQDIGSLLPLVQQVARTDSVLSNIYILSNPLPKTYRADLFNLFNGARPKNTVKLDDSRPGYFESAILLDAEGAARMYAKYTADESPVTATQTPKTPERQVLRAKQSKGDVVEAVALLHIQDLEATISSRKHASVMTTASTTASTAQQASTPTENSSVLPSPSLTFTKNMPLLPNQNLSNQALVCTKIPSIRQSFQSPMMHQSVNGSATTLKSSSTIARLDLDLTLLHNPAPSVITPVQVLVEGFQ